MELTGVRKKNRRVLKSRFTFLAVTACLLSSCLSPIPTAPTSVRSTSTITPQATTESTAAVTPPSLWIDPAIPDPIRQIALASGLHLTNSAASASTRLMITSLGYLTFESTRLVWIYALVAPFPTVSDGVGSEDVRLFWNGDPASSLTGGELWMDDSTLAVFTSLWGSPAGGTVRTAPAGNLSETLWSATRPVYALIPFQDLEPRWKVLTVGGQSPIRKEFDLSSYPLAAAFSCSGGNCSALNLPAYNRDPSKLTVVVMTGVTALVRRTAWTMEQKGITYPDGDIRDWLRSADITHISNEIPFAQDCPYPDPDQEEIRFCSDPRYIQLLEDVGADVIEMTGNHFQDWGSAATLFTLDLYRQRGWSYFGGGSDLADSQKSVRIEHNGNRIAFIGCNTSGPDYAWATDTQPGAAPCGDLSWLVDEISRLRSEGFQPIVTFQYYEYYSPEPRPNQSHDFETVAEAGAVIVSGSQAHIPQAMEFHDGSLILFGLGNLFFDQMVYPIGNVMSTSTRKELIARHVFYDNRHVSTELLTAMLEDYARPRPMTGQERVELLTDLFTVSGWK